MAVPKMSQLQFGLGVNVVLKADQRSGNLTSGRISEILTRGDHPRGIKVRLTDGQVGRVQSLSTNPDSLRTMQPLPASAAAPSRDNCTDYLPEQSKSTGRGERRGRITLQDDYRNDPTPVESRSLMDYVKVAPRSKTEVNRHSIQEDTVQDQFERDFPKLDTALIAAIIADNDDVEAARNVLKSLS